MDRIVGRGVIVIAVAGIALIAGIALGSLSRTPPASINSQLLASTVLENASRPIPDITLTDHNGKTFNRDTLSGQWSMIFLGYTHCPDICPLTLSVVNDAIKQLDSPGEESNVQVYFVSVDPKRDTAKRLAQYVPFFNSTFVGVTGEDPELMRLARGLSSVYSIGEADAETGDYLVDHSASILLVSPKAELHAVFTAPHDSAKIAADLTRILSYGS